MMDASSIGRILRLATVLVVFAWPAVAQTDSHACFPNDSIVDGKRIQPTQAEVEVRLNTPACRAALAGNQDVDESQAVKHELSDIDREIDQQTKALGVTASAGAN